MSLSLSLSLLKMCMMLYHLYTSASRITCVWKPEPSDCVCIVVLMCGKETGPFVFVVICDLKNDNCMKSFHFDLFLKKK